jgi:calcium-dependent protein kinase
MWSIGVILYIMLCGYPPFDGENEEEILIAVQKAKFEFKDPIWEHISADAKDLICKLLAPEDERISPKDALKHPWLISSKSKNEEIKTQLRPVHMERLRKFHKMANFKKVVLTFIASRTTDKEVMEEMKAFQSLDKNKDGYITVHELKSAIKGKMKEEEVKEILNGVDTDKNGAINYTEFIAATLNKILLNDRGKIEKAFKLLDQNGDGSINAHDLTQVLSGDKYQFFDASIVKEILQE